MLESISVFAIAAIILMLIGVIGSVTPMVPGALLSIAGILVYYWSTGYTRPSLLFLIGFILVGLVAVLTDYFAGSIAAKAGGATTRTSIIAGLVGFLMFFVAGPIGILVGVAGTVFLREFLISGDAEKSMKAAGYSTLGVLGSTAVQLLITVSLLAVFIAGLLI